MLRNPHYFYNDILLLASLITNSINFKGYSNKHRFTISRTLHNIYAMRVLYKVRAQSILSPAQRTPTLYFSITVLA